MFSPIDGHCVEAPFVACQPSYSPTNGRYFPNEKVSDEQTVPLRSQKLTRVYV
jgi:hypothetical protein